MAATVTTVKLSADAHAKLAKLAAHERRSMTDIVARLIEQERRRAFLEGANADYARLRARPDAWDDYQAETVSMDGTLMDGLADGPWIE